MFGYNNYHLFSNEIIMYLSFFYCNVHIKIGAYVSRLRLLPLLKYPFNIHILLINLSFRHNLYIHCVVCRTHKDNKLLNKYNILYYCYCFIEKGLARYTLFYFRRVCLWVLKFYLFRRSLFSLKANILGGGWLFSVSFVLLSFGC